MQAPEALSREELAASVRRIGREVIDGREVEGSRTAFATAFLRAFHAINEADKIFEDRMAGRLLRGEEYALFEEAFFRRARKAAGGGPVPTGSRQEIVAGLMRAGTAGGVLCRARFAEESLEAAVTDGVRQYVILGAGLDTFALRRPDLMDSLRVIEVDHPATQAVKRRRIASAGFSLPSALAFAPADFARQDLHGALLRAGFDPGAPAFFSLLGVTYYLGRKPLLATLAGLGAVVASRSRLVFDYLDADAFDPVKAEPRISQLLEKVRFLGEPMRSGMDPAALARDLAETGWRLREDLFAEGIEARYLRSRRDGFRVGAHLHLALADCRPAGNPGGPP